MPFKYDWDNPEKDIIRIEITGDWTWQEYDQSVIELSEMLATVEHRVDFIADMRESGRVPTGDYSSQHIKRGRQIRPKNYGMTVNVGANIIMKMTFSVALSLTEKKNPQPRYYVDTIEEAYEAIKLERHGADALESDEAN